MVIKIEPNFIRKILKRLISVFLLLSITNLLFSYIVQSNNVGSPKVSVIIPVYNASNYLKGCLDSVLKQSLIELEVICIDDGSTDDSLEILKKYGKEDFRIKIIHQENNGAAAARNAGIQIASGDYIAFIDSDDTIDLNAYEISYKKAKELDVDVLMFGEEKFSTPDTICTNGFEALNLSGAMMLWNKLYKRSFLVENDFKIPEDSKCYHDECFNSIVLPKAKCIRCISNKFYHYQRKRSGSIQTSSNLKKKADHVLFYASFVCENWKLNGYIEKYSYWLLKKVSFMINRVFDRLNFYDQIYYSKALKDILGDKVCNQRNIQKLSKYEKLLLHKWSKI